MLHRDIKPSHVLVAELDRPTPKLIDFGIAKGLDQKLVDVTLATGNRLLGTPEYMSPEALGLGGELETRSGERPGKNHLFAWATASTPRRIVQPRWRHEAAHTHQMHGSKNRQEIETHAPRPP